MPRVDPKWELATEFPSYADTPAYRRRWVYVLLVLFFSPGAILIGLTGPVYADGGDKIAIMPSWITIGLPSLFLGLGLFNLVMRSL